jgi:hypothetical protein
VPTTGATHTGKLLETRAKRKSLPTTRKSVKRAPARTAARPTAKKGGTKPTLRQLNAWLTRNQAQVLKKAKENSLRLIGRETL